MLRASDKPAPIRGGLITDSQPIAHLDLITGPYTITCRASRYSVATTCCRQQFSRTQEIIKGQKEVTVLRVY